MKFMRLAAMPMVAGLLLSGCGSTERPLASVGDISDRFIHPEPGVTVSTDSVVAVEIRRETRPAAELVWYTEPTPGQSRLSPEALLADALERSNGVSRFVQASSVEIWRVLPGIQFPTEVFEGIGFVSSQLVVDLESSSLDVGTSAAFGLWANPPYTVPREISQLAVLRVGLAAAFPDASPQLTEQLVEEGLTLSWSAGDYRYELFCRDSLAVAVCETMADAMALLSSIAP